MIKTLLTCGAAIAGGIVGDIVFSMMGGGPPLQSIGSGIAIAIGAVVGVFIARKLLK